MNNQSLFALAYDNDAVQIKKELALGRDPNEVHPLSGHTPLQAACQEDALQAMAALLEAGAQPNLVLNMTSRVSGMTQSGRVALMYAYSADAVSLLSQHGAVLDHVDDNGWTALALAVDGGRFDVAKRLIELGASQSIGGRVAKEYGDLRSLCISRIAFFKKNGDPQRAAPMLGRLEATLGLLGGSQE
jgi:ankyrin repeat protein